MQSETHAQLEENKYSAVLPRFHTIICFASRIGARCDLLWKSSCCLSPSLTSASSIFVDAVRQSLLPVSVAIPNVIVSEGQALYQLLFLNDSMAHAGAPTQQMLASRTFSQFAELQVGIICVVSLRLLRILIVHASISFGTRHSHKDSSADRFRTKALARPFLIDYFLTWAQKTLRERYHKVVPLGVPGKRLMYNTHPTVMEDRRVALQSWMQTLCNNPRCDQPTPCASCTDTNSSHTPHLAVPRCRRRLCVAGLLETIRFVCSSASWPDEQNWGRHDVELPP
eukprot:SAG11_NODE_27_length_23309_cov_10.579362_16_plen_283_part_00